MVRSKSQDLCLKKLEKLFFKAGFRFSLSHREGVGWTPSGGLKMTDSHKNRHFAPLRFECSKSTKSTKSEIRRSASTLDATPPTHPLLPPLNGQAAAQRKCNSLVNATFCMITFCFARLIGTGRGTLNHSGRCPLIIKSNEYGKSGPCLRMA